MTQNGPSLTALMLPDYREENPYQALLAAALGECNVVVRFPVGYRRVFPIWRAAGEGSKRPDIVHLHWLSPYLKGGNIVTEAFYALKLLTDLWLAKLSGSRIVWTVHNLIAHEARHASLERYIRRRIARLADRLVVHDSDAAQRVASLYSVPRKKIAEIPHGHFRSAYGEALAPQDARHHLKLPQDGLVFLFVGMLRPYKGVEHLLQAWQAHPTLATANHLIIAGKPQDAAYAERLGRQAETVLGVRFFPRFLDDREIAVFLSAADVVVLPLLGVLTSGSAVLAMSYGKPVIAPRMAALTALMKGADDLLYEDTSEATLGAALEQALHTDLAEIGARVRTACDRLEWPSIAESLRDQYLASDRGDR